jgi:hypothetical protein
MEYRDRADALKEKAERYRRNKHPRKANRLLWLADEYMERGNIAFCQFANKLMAKSSL